MPDIRVERARLTQDAEERGLREADLAGHLDNSAPSEAAPGLVGEAAERPQDSDYQLNQALILLKGLNITRAKK